MLYVSAGAITDGRKILCVQKGKSKYDYLSNRYEFPGGKVENGETPKDALVRELKEEMDADISGAEIRHIGDYEYTYPDFSVHLHVFLVTVSSFHFTLKEHTSSVWLQPERLLELDWVAADRMILGDLQRCLNE